MPTYRVGKSDSLSSCVGMATRIDQDLFVTCYHVLKDWAFESDDTKIYLFAQGEGVESLEVRQVACIKKEPSDDFAGGHIQDLALLRLAEKETHFDESFEKPIIVRQEWNPDERYKAIGFIEDKGLFSSSVVTFNLVYNKATRWYQTEHTGDAQIDCGFSGGPVCRVEGEAPLGIVKARFKQRQQPTFAHIMPMMSIWEWLKREGVIVGTAGNDLSKEEYRSLCVSRYRNLVGEMERLFSGSDEFRGALCRICNLDLQTSIQEDAINFVVFASRSMKTVLSGLSKMIDKNPEFEPLVRDLLNNSYSLCICGTLYDSLSDQDASLDNFFGVPFTSLAPDNKDLFINISKAIASDLESVTIVFNSSGRFELEGLRGIDRLEEQAPGGAKWNLTTLKRRLYDALGVEESGFLGGYLEAHMLSGDPYCMLLEKGCALIDLIKQDKDLKYLIVLEADPAMFYGDVDETQSAPQDREYPDSDYVGLLELLLIKLIRKLDKFRASQ
ncbi:MAG: serine protease [Verrucomicrobiota bacterium]